jgi:ElaB/YqjD/DUF883 family membrane-anchored ribosome-binding protein
MEDEVDVIRDQMQDTRTALTDKLEALEQQVVNTVQSITNPVVETVETVKKAVEDTVGAVRDTVQSTASTLSGAAEQTMETVKETFDLSRQVERHPWLMMAGAVAAGYLGGRLLLPDNTGSKGQPTTSGSPFPDSMSRATAEPPRHNGHHEGARTERAEPQEESWFSNLTETFAPEINQLKGLAIGAAVGVVRDLVTQGLKGEMGSRLKDWLNTLTEKVGGKPFAEPLIKPTQSESNDRGGSPGHRDRGTGPVL